MGIIETEYLEIRAITKGILAGSIDKETAGLALKAYSESGKRVDQYLKVLSMQISHGKAARALVSKNIISDGVAIDLMTKHDETFKCPAKGDLIIDRDTCLDYSGQLPNIDFCQGCEQFGITRRQVCP